MVLGTNVAEAQRPSRSGSRPQPTYERRLVEQFDQNENGRVEGPERAAALTWIRDEREKNPPRRRGSGGEDTTDLVPRRAGKGEVETYPDRDLYDVGVIRTIFLDFEQPEWADEMALLWRTGISTHATLTMDGKEYPDVGVRFRGSSSFFSILDRKKSRSRFRWTGGATRSGSRTTGH